MTDTPTSTGTPAAAPASTEAPTAAVQPQVVDLSAVPDEVLFKDPRFTTMVGRHAARQAEQHRSRIETEAQAKAIREQEQAMLDLARSNPFEFTNKWLGDKAQEIAKREFSELEAKTQRDILDKLGAAYGQVPEWRELSQDEFSDVAARTAGLTGAELIAAFNAAALDKVADKRAGKRVQSEVASRLKTEREAWERESAAARLRGEQPPDLSRPGAPSRFDPSRLSDEEFNRWYTTEGPGRNI